MLEQVYVWDTHDMLLTPWAFSFSPEPQVAAGKVKLRHEHAHNAALSPLQTVAEDGRFAAALTEQNVVSIRDMVAETSEKLEFRDLVVKMSIGMLPCGLHTNPGPACILGGYRPLMPGMGIVSHWHW